MNRKNYIQFFCCLFVSLAWATFSFAEIGGQPDSSNSFPSVVYFGAFECSGAKVSDRFYLTAAHCVNSVGDGPRIDFSDRSPLAKAIVVKGETLPYQAVHLKTISLHPSWRRKVSSKDEVNAIDSKVSQSELSDIAIVEIEEVLDLPSAILSFDPVDASASVVVGGFGSKDENEGGKGDGFTFGIVPLLGLFYEYLVIDSRTSVHTTVLLREGDSGGPAFVKSSQGVFEVVGINSWGRMVADPDGTTYEVSMLTSLNSRASNPGVKEWLCSIVNTEKCKRSHL